MVWAHRHCIELCPIDLGNPNQYAYVESFSGRLFDECRNGHWFTSLDHTKRAIESWRRKYDEERPKRSLGGMAHPLRIAVGYQGHYNSRRLETTLLLKRVVVRNTNV
jgi:putative transposase